jgi:6-phosphofructokinase 1
MVEGIQHDGGTILGSSRGPQEPKDMVDTLLKYNVGILFCIGGDGTFKGIADIANEVKARNLDIGVIGIPKTIDNDIYCSEVTFGLSTAVEKATEAIYSAHEEAKAAYNGIGLVKLMGRHSGFIAVKATLANSDVNFCLIPEVSFNLVGENGFLPALKKRLEKRHHAVIVLAEGAGQDLIKSDDDIKKDASGNILNEDIGLYLKDQISTYLKNEGMYFTVKYIDPSYTIRSCAADADDSIFCLMLAQNAAHAGMAGKTNMFVGYWNHHFTHVPLRVAIGKRKRVDPNGTIWQMVREITK